MRANWTVRSLQRLQQIHDHIALDQPLNANRFVDRLTRRAETIALQPRAGRIVPEYQSDDIRETFEGATLHLGLASLTTHERTHALSRGEKKRLPFFSPTK
ncbi:MAG: type II toxin-antitoxin system RelE/ParE family toxin [Chromatiales bacterium]